MVMPPAEALMNQSGVSLNVPLCERQAFLSLCLAVGQQVDIHLLFKIGVSAIHKSNFLSELELFYPPQK